MAVIDTKEILLIMKQYQPEKDCLTENITILCNRRYYFILLQDIIYQLKMITKSRYDSDALTNYLSSYQFFLKKYKYILENIYFQ